MRSAGQRWYAIIAVLGLVSGACTDGSSTNVIPGSSTTSTVDAASRATSTTTPADRPVPANPASPNVPTDGSTDWPMFAHDSRHLGLSSDTSIGFTNASNLELIWQTQTGQSTYSSPAVVYSSDLEKHVVYVGNEGGVISALDALTGERIWWFQAEGPISSSPAVANNTVYVGSSDDHLYALDATTGELICRFDAGGNVVSSPVVANLDGSGLVVYFGDSGITGGDDGGHMWAINAVDPNGAEDCSPRWSFDAFGDPPDSNPDAGSWSPPALGTDRNGRHLVFFGSSSVDNSVYALDASDGSLVWRFETERFHNDNDVGAGPTISPPGENLFDAGAVFIAGKNGIVYALNLETGEKYWEFRIRDVSPDAGGAPRSTAALVDGILYVGYGAGVYALDVKTGRAIWDTAAMSEPTGEVLSSPAITGPIDDRVLFVGDLTGGIFAFDLFDGRRVWESRAESFIFGSPAASAAKIFIPSDDGFLYAFGFRDQSSTPPSSEITFPAPTADVDDGISAETPGFDLFTSNCASCHGPSAEGGIGPSLRATDLTPDQIEVTMRRGREGTAMPAFEDALSDDQIQTLVQFVVGLPELSTADFVGNPDGDLFIEGTASDDSEVTEVRVAIRDDNENAWWNAESREWTRVFMESVAEINVGGDRSATWRYGFPVPFEGSTYYIQAQAVDADGQKETVVQRTTFTVDSLGDPPDTEISAPAFAEVFHFPGGERQVFPIEVAGTAADTGGDNPGIATVHVVIRNVENGMHYCGSPGCGGAGPSGEWTPTFTSLAASLNDPGAPSTGWDFEFPTYDEPHKYRIVAWAEDNDGEIDSTRAVLMRICVRDEGDNACV